MRSKTTHARSDGSKVPSIYDVAREARVSVFTVSAVINNKGGVSATLARRVADFALVSFDDYPWLGCFRPRLTTIELSKYELGATAVRLLLELVESKRTRAKTVTLQPQLRVRESCGFMLRSIKAAVTA